MEEDMAENSHLFSTYKHCCLFSLPSPVLIFQTLLSSYTKSTIKTDFIIAKTFLMFLLIFVKVLKIITKTFLLKYLKNSSFVKRQLIILKIQNLSPTIFQSPIGSVFRVNSDG